MDSMYENNVLDDEGYEGPADVARNQVCSTDSAKPKLGQPAELPTAACINWVILILCLMMSSTALGVALYALGTSMGQPGEAPCTNGNDGPVGAKGDPGSSGGAIYTRWGHASCGANSTLVYDGFAGMSRFDHPGGGVNYQCMVFDAEYNKYTSTMVGGFVAGVEYASSDYGIFEDAAHLQNVPCAVCYANNRPSVLMIPGKRTCPSDAWHKEYEGYLMSARSNHVHPTTYECVDGDPEYVNGLQGDDSCGYFFFNEPLCNGGVSCPPYFSVRAITCVVCTM